MSKLPDNTGRKQRGRQFRAGVSGNPAGRPKGSRNKASGLIEAMLVGEAEQLARVAIDKALEGDMTALKLCLDRLAPPRRYAPVRFDLPPIDGAADTKTASSAILRAVANGDLSPDEGAGLMDLLMRHKTIVEAADDPWPSLLGNFG